MTATYGARTSLPVGLLAIYFFVYLTAVSDSVTPTIPTTPHTRRTPMKVERKMPTPVSLTTPQQPTPPPRVNFLDKLPGELRS